MKMNYTETQTVMQNYVCSICWGHLMAYIEDGAYVVRCAKYGDAHSGYVRRTYAERRKAESFFEAVEARANLKDVLGLGTEGDAEKRIDELFG